MLNNPEFCFQFCFQYELELFRLANTKLKDNVSVMIVHSVLVVIAYFVVILVLLNTVMLCFRLCLF